MSLQACADLVARGDPDRFLATMSTPPAARAVLFPIYAFNIEVARAPWLTAEPMIAEMRLQWWRDVLEEIAAGGPVRRHEVCDALAPVLDATGARLLGDLVEARRLDIQVAPFERADALERYLEATSGNLTQAAARALGAAGPVAPLRDIAVAAGLARWLQAVPQLVARGRVPLPDTGPGAIAALAQLGLSRLKRGRAAALPRAARPAVRDGWRAGVLLRQARRHPERVMAGTLGQSEFARRISLIGSVLAGR